MHDDEDIPTTKVGYKNPPVHSRFKPGISGNPGGRAKGKTTGVQTAQYTKFLELLLDEANEIVDVKESGKLKKMTRKQAFIRSIGNKAMTDSKMAREYLSLILAAEKISPVGTQYDLSKLSVGELEQLRGLLLKATPATKI